VLDGDLDTPRRGGEGCAFDAAFDKLLWPPAKLANCEQFAFSCLRVGVLSINVIYLFRLRIVSLHVARNIH